MKNTIIILIFLLLGLFSYSQKNVEVKVDASIEIGNLEPFWASQIIHPTEFLLTGWGEKFLELLKESGAAQQYIRIYNQPEQAIRVDKSGNVTYDWSRFDRMADMILATGNKPHVVFFGMPVEFAAYSEPVRKRPYGAVVSTSQPKDYKKWEELCADFTTHVINKYGISTVKDWTFRCWNEPDGGFWYKKDLDEYLKLYDYFAKGVKGVNSAIRIGGPALTGTGTWNKPQNFDHILKHFAEGTNYATGAKGSPVDFISVHTYGGSGGHGGPGWDYPSVDYILEQQKRLADMRDKYPTLKHLPIYMEEWGVSSHGTRGLDKEPMTDVRNSEYGAAFLTTMVAKHIQWRQDDDRNIRQFTFCSSGYEKIPEHDFMGYRTFDTKNGFHKPILNAYKLLKKLDSQLIHVEQDVNENHITAFATKGKNTIKILVTNFQNDKIYNDGEPYNVSVSLKFDWNKNSKVTVKHWRIDNNHSNSYTAFKELGQPKLPNPIEIDQIKARMELELLENPQEKKLNDLEVIDFQLPCNAVSLIEIER